jgi:hypothetical protein
MFHVCNLKTIILEQSFKITITANEKRIDMHTSLTREDHHKHEHIV